MCRAKRINIKIHKIISVTFGDPYIQGVYKFVKNWKHYIAVKGISARDRVMISTVGNLGKFRWVDDEDRRAAFPGEQPSLARRTSLSALTKGGESR